MLNVFVPQIVLDRPCVVPIVDQLVPPVPSDERMLAVSCGIADW